MAEEVFWKNFFEIIFSCLPGACGVYLLPFRQGKSFAKGVLGGAHMMDPGFCRDDT
jgi:hypothetical protein